jgi:hypothetical protein
MPPTSGCVGGDGTIRPTPTSGRSASGTNFAHGKLPLLGAIHDHAQGWRGYRSVVGWRWQNTCRSRAAAPTSRATAARSVWCGRSVTISWPTASRTDASIFYQLKFDHRVYPDDWCIAEITKSTIPLTVVTSHLRYCGTYIEKATGGIEAMPLNNSCLNCRFSPKV